MIDRYIDRYIHTYIDKRIVVILRLKGFGDLISRDDGFMMYL